MQSAPLRRPTKGELREILTGTDWSASLATLESFPHRRLVSSLVSMLYEGDPLVHGRAVAALGHVTGRIANEDLEAARVVMRRLMWSLNDESGGIGWGAPEAMAEIMIHNDRLATEYAHILVSYLDPRGNYLEHEPLHPGLLWAVARVAESRPDLLKGATAHLGKYMGAKNPATRGLAAMAAGLLAVRDLAPALKGLVTDEAEFQYFRDGVVTAVVGEMAARAIASVPEAAGPTRSSCDPAG